MKEILRQLNLVWREMKGGQKMVALAILVSVVCGLGFLMFKAPRSTYAPLFPGKILTSAELTEVRSYLDRLSIPFQEEGEKGVLVLAEQADQIRNTLAGVGIPKSETGKGFELFDTNTWIKGEKELQVLELRALKGQLEKDLAAFELIKSAHVILDIPPQRSFNGPKYPTKASVILTLMPGARLSGSALRAITNHLTGAVRGLETQMIAISDTTGRLYKAIEANATEAPIREVERLFEENLEEKISDLLARIVGEGHFHATVQAVLDRETELPFSLSVAVVVDKEIECERAVKNHLSALIQGYGLASEPVISFLPFKTEKMVVTKKKRGHTVGFLFTGFIVVIALMALFLFLKRYKKQKSKEDEGLFGVMTKVDINKLAGSIQNEDPQTIALMLSYLEPNRAEQMIAALHSELQDQVLFHLSELEKDEHY